MNLITETYTADKNAAEELLGAMLNNTRSVLSQFTEARQYGTAIHIGPSELVQHLKNNVLNGIFDLCVAKYDDPYLGSRLYETGFIGEYTFPNKHAYNIINGVISETSRKMPIMTSNVTLEGEGPEIGKATLLTRIGGCAIRCKGCDTPHSWNAEPLQQTSEDGLQINNFGLMDISDISNMVIKQAEAANIKRISITGGEPLHYLDALRLLIADLWLQGFYINLETSGVIFDPIIFAMTHTSIDIKTPSARVDLTPTQLGALHAMASYKNPHPCHLKAVIGTKGDLDFVHQHFMDVLNGHGVYRPLCFTPFGPVNDADVDLSSLGTTVDMICDWMFIEKVGTLDTRQIRVINQQHKVFGCV